MVKVVDGPPVRRTTCYNCRSTLEYSFRDITSEYVRDYDMGGDTYHRIVCPECNLKNNVPRFR
jgi:RNase P subunit RPR2